MQLLETLSFGKVVRKLESWKVGKLESWKVGKLWTVAHKWPQNNVGMDPWLMSAALPCAMCTTSEQVLHANHDAVHQINVLRCTACSWWALRAADGGHCTRVAYGRFTRLIEALRTIDGGHCMHATDEREVGGIVHAVDGTHCTLD